MTVLPPTATVALDVLDALDRLLVLEEQDRGALADRLHDGPLQDLVAARYLADLTLHALRALPPVDALPAVTARATAVRDADQDALVATRRLLGSLTARCTDGRGLPAALTAVAGSVASAGLTADVVAGPDSGELDALRPGTAVVAHRLAQALLVDAAARGATTATVRAERVPPSYDGAPAVLRVVVTGTVTPDLEEPGVARWVARAGLLGGHVATGPAGTTVHLPLHRPGPPATAPPTAHPVAPAAQFPEDT